MNFLRVAALIVALPAALFASSACSPIDYLYDYAVTIDPAVEITAGRQLMVVSAAADGGIESAYPGGSSELVAGTNSYENADAACCLREGEHSFYAFVDANDNGAWDEGEPWGADPTNPVNITRDGYRTDILVVLDHVAP